MILPRTIFLTECVSRHSMIAIRIRSGSTAVARQKGRPKAKLYRRSASAYDSLAEAYLKNGDIKSVMNNYLKSRELNLDKANAKEILKTLER